jgi:hypothetical protein
MFQDCFLAPEASCPDFSALPKSICVHVWIIKVKVKFSCSHHRGSRGTAPLILSCDSRWRWIVNFMPWLLYPGKEHQHPSNRRLGRPQSWSGCFWKREKSLAPTGIWTLDRPARSLGNVWIILPEKIIAVSLCTSASKSYRQIKISV